MIVETRDRALLLETVDAPFKLIHPMRPQPGPGQVLVRIHASGVNPLDTKIRAGKGGHARQTLPAVLGMDLAGVVASVGEGVSNFAPGDEVYGMAGGIGGNPGTLADYQALDADLLAKKPVNLDMRQAAALPLVAITAWEGMVDRARVGAGHKVLVHGGAGGVGHVAIQIARAFGAEVYATGSAENLAVIEGFGAIAIDYRSTAVEDYVARHTDGRGFDIVYDTVGGATLDASFQAVRHYTGHVVSALGWGEHKLAPLSFRGATYSGVFTLLPLLTGEGRKHHGEILAKVARLVEDGKLKVRLDPHRFSLEEALDAHRLVASGDAQGKVVVDLVG
ncbi:zinc-dependent alcohol dehydrogenase family protein [Pseudomonas resinovorans]|uniref:zinc-dependent alcohol dehydrogenase family protein n=1 Tax=Metapseudomonas resinovorans TaxID=53412 RepID=UPI00237F43F6|nr:zinc-dependent alcohol dehydrogenase family protein [Pseudomonas resinovorans]MDE3735303.1 zinc-dependent alcohol dehydrogenase family protein [Pseudomonas resinovorans]